MAMRLAWSGAGDASPPITHQPVAVFPLFAGGDPACGDAVCAVSAEFAERGRPTVSRGIDICHETVRLWWHRFGLLFAADIRRPRIKRMRGFRSSADGTTASRSHPTDTFGACYGTFLPTVTPLISVRPPTGSSMSLKTAPDSSAFGPKKFP